MRGRLVPDRTLVGDKEITSVPAPRYQVDVESLRVEIDVRAGRRNWMGKIAHDNRVDVKVRI